MKPRMTANTRPTRVPPILTMRKEAVEKEEEEEEGEEKEEREEEGKEEGRKVSNRRVRHSLDLVSCCGLTDSFEVICCLHVLCSDLHKGDVDFI